MEGNEHDDGLREDVSRQGAAREGVRRPAAPRKRVVNARAEAKREVEPNMADASMPAKRGSLDAPANLLPPAAYEFSKQQRRAMGVWWKRTITAFKVLLFGGMVLGALLFLRPAVSQAENRTLTEFPAFTWETFVDGSFFSDVSLWYSDTFPFRDQLIALDRAIDSLYGIQTSTQLVGTAQKADDIPSQTDEEAAQAAAVKEEEPAKVPEEYNPADLEASLQGQILGSSYVKDGAAYVCYYFTQEAATAYAHAINKAQADLAGTTNVYSILAPNNSGAMLSDDELNAMGGSNQEEAIKYYYSLYDSGVTTVPAFDKLRQHNAEYLFFKTDHHWTALGAYYVYQALCETMGIQPHELSQFVEEDFPDFSGTYADMLASAGMGDSVDTVQAWVPMGTNDMVLQDENSNETPWRVIEDVSGWATNSKYNAFIGGDQASAVITNPSITDGSSCVVVKESFGNAFVPWLVDHYQTVYVMDFRYYQGNVAEFCKQNGVQDLIVLNNISIAGNVDVAGKLESIF